MNGFLIVKIFHETPNVNNFAANARDDIIYIQL